MSALNGGGDVSLWDAQRASLYFIQIFYMPTTTSDIDNYTHTIAYDAIHFSIAHKFNFHTCGRQKCLNDFMKALNNFQ